MENEALDKYPSWRVPGRRRRAHRHLGKTSVGYAFHKLEIGLAEPQAFPVSKGLDGARTRHHIRLI